MASTKISAMTAATDLSGAVIPLVQSLTNKQITRKNFFKAIINSQTTASSITPNIDDYDVYEITALDQTLTINNPTGTPHNTQSALFKISDDGTSRTINFGISYNANGGSLPTSTTVGEILYVPFIYNGTTSEWDYIGTAGAQAQITGLDTQVLFFDGADNPAGDAGLVYNKTTKVLTADGFVVNGETASRIAIIDASKNVKSADTATYPSLTELIYLKGVGNPIQSQINSLGAGTRLYLFNSY